MSPLRALGTVVAACFVFVSCGDARQTATAVIETEIADQVGLGDLAADCDEPESPEVGEMFACTATTEDGDLIQLTVEFEEEDRIFVLPTNVLLGDDMPLVEAEAADTIGEQVGAVIDPTDVSCPDTTVVMDANDQMRCTITDTADGVTYELVVTLTEFVRDEGFQRRFYEVGDAIQ